MESFIAFCKKYYSASNIELCTSNNNKDITSSKGRPSAEGKNQTARNIDDGGIMKRRKPEEGY